MLAKHPNWQDCSLLPTTPKESKAANHKVQQQKDPLEKEGIVGAFCRAYYPIELAISEFLSDVYSPTADISGRYDYIPGEGSAGVVIYDDKFVYSHHATDLQAADSAMHLNWYASINSVIWKKRNPSIRCANLR